MIKLGNLYRKVEKLLEDPVEGFEESYEKARSHSGTAEEAIKTLLDYESGITGEIPDHLEDSGRSYVAEELEKAYRSFEEAISYLEENTNLDSAETSSMEEIQRQGRLLMKREGKAFPGDDFAEELDRFKGVVNYAMRAGVPASPRVFGYHDTEEFAEAVTRKQL